MYLNFDFNTYLWNVDDFFNWVRLWNMNWMFNSLDNYLFNWVRLNNEEEKVVRARIDTLIDSFLHQNNLNRQKLQYDYTYLWDMNNFFYWVRLKLDKIKRD